MHFKQFHFGWYRLYIKAPAITLWLHSLLPALLLRTWYSETMWAQGLGYNLSCHSSHCTVAHTNTVVLSVALSNTIEALPGEVWGSACVVLLRNPLSWLTRRREWKTNHISHRFQVCYQLFVYATVSWLLIWKTLRKKKSDWGEMLCENRCAVRLRISSKSINPFHSLQSAYSAVIHGASNKRCFPRKWLRITDG